MSKRKILSILYKLKRITKKLLENGLKKIVKMQNLSLNELKQIERMKNFSENKLKQIAQTRHIKNYKDMSKEDLIIALLKSNRSHTELRESKDNNTEIVETKKLFNELRDNFLKEEIKKIRRKFYVKESIDEYLKELQEKDSLPRKKKKTKSIIPRYYKTQKSILKS